MRQYNNRLYRVCKAVIGFVFRSPGVFGDKCGVPVFQMKKREPGMVFVVLYYNIFGRVARKCGKRVYAVGKTRRLFRLKRSRARHSFSVNARVLRACTRVASLEGCLIDDAYKTLRESAKSSAYKSRWLSTALSA